MVAAEATAGVEVLEVEKVVVEPGRVELVY